jgi:hypothetical protein
MIQIVFDGVLRLARLDDLDQLIRFSVLDGVSGYPVWVTDDSHCLLSSLMAF